MKNFILFIKVFFIYSFLFSGATAKESEYLKQGIQLFNKQEYEKSKILFERDIVYDPKSEKSYLYLAKIFNKNKNDTEEEINLNNVLLINPQNDEAIYMLTLLKIKKSDYNEAKKLIERFDLVCKSFCSKKSEIKKKFKKLTP
tara:strand:+ start:2609 stop:3037 length:429 start_codon:yes stop_codon:yes gene_type:complete